jgi:xanthine dehydrogenase accessory factor
MYPEIYREIARMIEAGEEGAVATVIGAAGSTPRESGAKMLIYSDGRILGTVGGGNIEKQVIKEALEVIRASQAKKLDYRLAPGGELGMICGGNTEVFIEPILVAPALFIFGAGHIGQPLAKMARLAGFKIIVVDDRAEFATPDRFPGATSLVVVDFTHAFEQLDVNENSFIVIITHGHLGDETVLAGALKTPAKYIGMIGSRSKNAVVFAHLRAQGYTQADLDRAHAPIGLPIHAQTPEEIAVSILAEVIQARRSDDTK